MLQALEMSYVEVKALSEEWCEEAGIDRQDTWYYPFKPEAMTVTQVLWRMIEEHRMTTLKGMREYFNRYLSARGIQA